MPAPAPVSRLIADPTVRRLATVLVVSAVGNGLFLAVSTLWFTRGLGYSPARVGLTLSVAGVCGILAAFPAGRACDRYGAKAVLSVLLTVQALAMALFAVPGPYAFFLGSACLVTAAGQANGAARNALYAHSLDPAVRTRALGLLRALNNVGIGAGAALGALVLALDTPTAFRTAVLANAASFLLALLPLRAVTAVRPTAPSALSRPDATSDRPRTAARAASPWRDLPFLAATALNAVVNLLYIVLEVVLPLWLVNRTDAPRVLVGWLLVVNTGLVVLLQVRATRGVDDLATAGRSFRRGGILVALSCLAAAFAAHRSPAAAGGILLLAVVLLTLGEITSQAGSWAISFGMAAEHAQGAYQGVYYTGISIGQVLGPGLLTTLVLPHGRTGWAALAAVFAAAALALPRVLRRAAARPPREIPLQATTGDM